MLFRTKLDPVGCAYKPFSIRRAQVGELDRTAGRSGLSVDRMLQGARVYQQVGESCCGEAEAQAASALSEVAGDRKHFSAVAAYYYARLEEYKLLNGGATPNPDTLEDDGTFPFAVLTAWKLHGLPLEEDWPRNPELLNKPPSWGAVAEGDYHKAGEFYLIDSIVGRLLLDIEQAIRANLPVMLTVPVDAPMLAHTGSEPLGVRTGKILGLHRMCGLGITVDGKLICVNSWGPDWGQGGLGFLEPQFIVQQARDVTCLSSMSL